MYPLLFTQIRRDMLWGCETWTVSGRVERGSVVENGPLSGQSLANIIERDRLYYLGLKHCNDEGFPLLVKIIDARENLSVQVHPQSGQDAKDEAWYILDAPDNAVLIAGLKNGVTRRGFEQCIADGRVLDCLDKVKISPGQLVNIPAGRPHAITAGVKLIEIQQSSDTTYRIFDYNRTGSDGKPRDLHITEALSVVDFEGSREIEAFSLKIFKTNGIIRDVTDGRFCLLSCVSGGFVVQTDQTSVKLEEYRTTLIPAGLGKYAVCGSGIYIKSFI